MPSEPQSRHPEQGSGTVLTLGLIAALIVLLAAVQGLSAAAVANRQAARAADLTALAAADAARGFHAADPCTVAEHTASRNESVLEECAVGGDHPAEVRVRVSTPLEVAGLPHQVIAPGLRTAASSRAGPPEALHR